MLHLMSFAASTALKTHQEGFNQMLFSCISCVEIVFSFLIEKSEFGSANLPFGCFLSVPRLHFRFI